MDKNYVPDYLQPTLVPFPTTGLPTAFMGQYIIVMGTKQYYIFKRYLSKDDGTVVGTLDKIDNETQRDFVVRVLKLDNHTDEEIGRMLSYEG